MSVGCVPVGGEVVEAYASAVVSIVLMKESTDVKALSFNRWMCACLYSVFRGMMEKWTSLSRECGGKLSSV